jgi:hypothetical protein
MRRTTDPRDPSFELSSAYEYDLGGILESLESILGVRLGDVGVSSGLETQAEQTEPSFSYELPRQRVTLLSCGNLGSGDVERAGKIVNCLGLRLCLDIVDQKDQGLDGAVGVPKLTIELFEGDHEGVQSYDESSPVLNHNQRLVLKYEPGLEPNQGWGCVTAEIGGASDQSLQDLQVFIDEIEEELDSLTRSPAALVRHIQKLLGEERSRTMSLGVEHSGLALEMISKDGADSREYSVSYFQSVGSERNRRVDPTMVFSGGVRIVELIGRDDLARYQVYRLTPNDSSGYDGARDGYIGSPNMLELEQVLRAARHQYISSSGETIRVSPTHLGGFMAVIASLGR